MIRYPPHFHTLSPRLQTLWFHFMLQGPLEVSGKRLADALGGGAQHLPRRVEVLLRHGYLVALPGPCRRLRVCFESEYAQVRPVGEGKEET